MSAFVVRPWQESDTRELRYVFRRSVREIAARDYRPKQIAAWVDVPGQIEAWAERMRSRFTLAAAETGRLIGFIQYEPPDHIDMIYVHPDRQRQGVASALLAGVEAEAAKRGTKVLTVEASITSRPFFVAKGFEVVTPQIVTVRGQEFLNYRMVKRLGG